MQKIVIFVKESLKINMLKIKVRDHCHYTDKYRGIVHRIYNLRYTISNKTQSKRQKKYFIKRKLKFEDYKNCSEATQHENKINHLEKYEADEQT